MDAAPVRLRALREHAGLSQAQLAERARVSRALVSAVERGRHRPAVDTALRLAAAVGSTVEELFGPDADLGPDAPAATTIDGHAPAAGALVRLATVGARTVAVPLAGPDGEWATADALIAADGPRLLPGGQRGGALVAGCDPALAVAAALGPREGDQRTIAAPATSGAARRALRAGRVHAAVVHGPR
uniref:helix-turn-helix transcriptional regulator n=1 Tax=Patulibacter defluvii TaxID=3095358 RepID=UPI002A7611C4